jgi:ATP/maltotriose-dependent transcriptional regulator MalT
VHQPRPADLLLDGVALLVTAGPAAAAPVLRQASSSFARVGIPAQEVLRWGWLAREADYALWDDDGWRTTSRQVRLARDAGALDQLPFLLNQMALEAAYRGDFADAASLIAEAEAVCAATGSRIAPYAAMMLASLRGNEAEAVPFIQSSMERAAAGGQGVAVTWAHRATAILYNGLGRHQEALAAARQASEHAHVYVSMWAWPDLIEAAARSGDMRIARQALDRLTETTRAGGTEYGRGIEARSRALLTERYSAERNYSEAIGRLSRTQRRPELARAHLLFGEWLRRERRPGEARDHLHTAYQMLDAMGMEAFAERARRELLAAGATTAKRPVHADRDSTALTAQEAQVARLARDGLSNPQIAARLFISARTVQYHLGKVFAKLSISSRRELHRMLPDDSHWLRAG